MNEIIIGILVLVALIAAFQLWKGYVHEVIVWEHEFVLLFRDGRFMEELSAGKHQLIGRGFDVRRFDRRCHDGVIQGQEFLTADKAPVKVSGIVRYRIIDPRKHLGAAVDPFSTLYCAVQIALRDVIGAVTVEDVLEHKSEFGGQLQEIVAPVAELLGYELASVQVRDLMVSGDLKRVFTQVMTAKQEALAELERARGEAAAIRVMGNAARVYEKNPALIQLQFLKALEGGAGMNNQLIMGPLDPLMSFLRK